MKIKDIRALFYSLILTTFTLTSSCYDAVFQSIRDEITLKDPIINGYINSIVRYQDAEGKEYLYTQNGSVYRKQISQDGNPKELTKNSKHNKWSKVSNPKGNTSYDYYGQKFKGTYAIKLASDDKYIYLLTSTPVYDEDSSRNILKNFRLYYRNESTEGWKSVEKINEILKSYSRLMDEDNYMMDISIQLFCTNAPQKEHRKAFIRIGGGSPYHTNVSKRQEYSNEGLVDKTHCAIFRLDGNEAPSAVEYGSGAIEELKEFFTHNDYANKYDKDEDRTISRLGAGCFTTSCVWYDNQTLFFDYLATCTNETKDADASYVYFGDGSTLRYYNKDDKAGLNKKIKAIKVYTPKDPSTSIIEYEVKELTAYDAFYVEVDDKKNPIYKDLTEGVKEIVDFLRTPYFPTLTGKPSGAADLTFTIKAVKTVKNESGSKEDVTEELPILDAVKQGYTEFLDADGVKKGIIKVYLSQDDNYKDKILAFISATPSTNNLDLTIYKVKEINAIDAIKEGYTSYLSSLENIKTSFIAAPGSAGDSIISICFMQDKLYLGTDEEGAYQAPISEGLPARITNKKDGSTKYSTQMPAPYIVRALLCVDPSLPEKSESPKNSIYSSLQFRYTENNASASYRNVGLWAYYAGSSGWNKE